jgi:putative nucleotidyltransferase with HDIG domain
LRQLLESPQNETVQQAAERVLALVGALAKHDRKTRGHAERVRSLTDLIAERMALPQHDRDRLRWAALLHDIGKLQVSSELLNKDGKPTAQEWEVIRRHPAHGAEIAAPLMSWLEGWGDVIVQHHERWDGAGYPHGLAGAEICLGARIVSVADAYDVMTSTRAYKKPIGRAAALRELTRCAGSQFDPTVVRAMVAVPSRRLVFAMGPLSWVSGVPFVGQTAVVSQTGTAIGAAALTGAAAFSPVFDLSPTPHPARLSLPVHAHSGHAAGDGTPAREASTSTEHAGQAAAGRAPAGSVAHSHGSHPSHPTKPVHTPAAPSQSMPHPSRSPSAKGQPNRAPGKRSATPAPATPSPTATPTPTSSGSSGPGGGGGHSGPGKSPSPTPTDGQ